MSWKSLELTGWGRNSHQTALTARPERQKDLQRAIGDSLAQSGLVAHGGLRAYGDQALPRGDDQHALLTTRMNRILAFDSATGIVTVEAGMCFRDMIRAFVPKGWLIPVSPGTAFATMGGAIANDIHGKNHDTLGSFGNHVLGFELITPDGNTQQVTPDHNLFRATIGGCGLTGVITTVTVQLKKISGNCVQVTETKIKDLESYLIAFDEAIAQNVDYTVGWIDGLAKGKRMGRGIFETGTLSDETIELKPAKEKSVPIDFPALALNPLSVRSFNLLYRNRFLRKSRTTLTPFEAFNYPLDAISDWNRIYGKRGFHQFQCVIPRSEGERALPLLLDTIARSGAGSFLSVLKTMGGDGRGLLSFPMKGYTLALDFPHKAGVEGLFRSLHKITADHGGRIYLAKDSMLTRDEFDAMYPHADEMRQVLASLPHSEKLTSQMAARLALTGDAA